MPQGGDRPARPPISSSDILEEGQPRGGGVTAGDLYDDGWAEAFADLPSELDVPAYEVNITPEVQYFLERFTGERRDLTALRLNRAGRYLRMIRDVFKGHGLPEELAFLAMVESGYNPLAVSRAGAKGLWQFMAGTARQYGLRVDRWVDERLDPEKSTVAAAAHLTDLHRRFGSWSLAKAAYNAGAMKVERAVRAVGSTDFDALAKSRFLRRETKRFVPAVHAAIVIGRDPERWGFEGEGEEPSSTELVDVPPAMSLKMLAAADIPLETLKSLNPALIRGVAPPDGSYRLRVPTGAAERVVVLLAYLKAQGVETGVHVVRRGESLWEIAREHGLTVAELVRWNQIKRPELIRPGDRLRVVQLPLSAEAGASSRSR